MAKIKNLKVSFTASTSPDVIKYKLYVSPVGTELSYNSESFDLGNVTSFILSDLDGMINKDGMFNFGVVAVDDAGNESDMTIAENIALDFVAPGAPVGITVTQV